MIGGHQKQGSDHSRRERVPKRVTHEQPATAVVVRIALCKAVEDQGMSSRLLGREHLDLHEVVGDSDGVGAERLNGHLPDRLRDGGPLVAVLRGRRRQRVWKFGANVIQVKRAGIARFGKSASDLLTDEQALDAAMKSLTSGVE